MSTVKPDSEKGYAPGHGPICCYCGRPIAKADVVWGSPVGAWHQACTPTIWLADGTIAKIVA